MSAKVEEIVKQHQKETKIEKPKRKAPNKGKRLRGGKFVRYIIRKPKKNPEPEKLLDIKLYYSDKTGKYYSTYKQMKNAERLSKRMKRKWARIKQSADWRLRKIKDYIGDGIDWEDLRGWKNTDFHKEGNILYEIFYENNRWDKLTYDMIYDWYRKKRKSIDLEKINREILTPIEESDELRIGDYILMELPDIQGRTFYDFIKDVVNIPQNKIVLH